MLVTLLSSHLSSVCGFTQLEMLIAASSPGDLGKMPVYMVPLLLQVGLFFIIPVAFLFLYTYMLKQRRARLGPAQRQAKQRQD